MTTPHCFYFASQLLNAVDKALLKQRQCLYAGKLEINVDRAVNVKDNSILFNKTKLHRIGRIVFQISIRISYTLELTFKS